jgi:hypothetical protein
MDLSLLKMEYAEKAFFARYQYNALLDVMEDITEGCFISGKTVLDLEQNPLFRG